MNCYLHSEVPPAAFCRSCGKPLCDACQHIAHGTIYCAEHAPIPATDPQNPYVQPPVTAVPPEPKVGTSPGLAFFLGFIPGVGAIYNGQYLKGLVHAIIFGLLVSLGNSVEHSAGESLIWFVLVAFIFYMPFEAYHTSQRRLRGLPVEEFSSLVAPNKFHSRTPIGPILLIVIGILFLLDTLHLVEFREIAKFWPVLLIVAGAFMLYNRMRGEIVPVNGPVSGEYVEPRQ